MSRTTLNRMEMEKMNLAEQARLGRIVLVAMMIVLCIPLMMKWITLPQALTIKGTYIRENSRTFPRFLEAVKKHNGVLVLGTSETDNHLSGENYWALLNRDRNVKPYFSVLGGAGRCSYVWFPPILANPESFKGLTVLYYLNPTYWRDDLNRFSEHYYERYNDASLVLKVVPSAKSFGVWPFIEPYDFGRYQPKGWREIVSNKYKDYKTYYSYDLRSLLKGGPAPKSHDYGNPDPREIEMWQDGLDLIHNVSREYFKQNPATGIPGVGRSDFQYRALNAFVDLSKRVGIRLVVFIGPYNGILARQYSPQVIPRYEMLLDRVKQTLKQSQTEFIDGTDLSYSKGAFRDAQHNSTFGAWKIEQKIAAYFNR